MQWTPAPIRFLVGLILLGGVGSCALPNGSAPAEAPVATVVPPARGTVVSAVPLGTSYDADRLGNFLQGQYQLQKASYPELVPMFAELQKVFGPSLIDNNVSGMRVTHLKVTYWTQDAAGKALKASGALFVPASGNSAFPLLSVQHGTNLLRGESPSRYSLTNLETNPAPLRYVGSFLEPIYGALMAGKGYIVVLPDYAGLGDSYELHPYAHLSSANAVVDLIRAAKTVLGQIGAGQGFWNGQLFLTGYSEGGYVTMAAGRAFQALNDAEDNTFMVTAMAPLAGPYDLSTTMRQIMVSDAVYGGPFFLPYFIQGYQSVYGTTDWGWRNVLLEPYATEVPPWLNGDYTGDNVNLLLKPAQGVLRNVLTPQALALIGRPYTGAAATDGPLVTQLAANDAYRGWSPRMKVKLFHGPADELVPYGNAMAAMAAFSSNPQVETLQDVAPLAINGSTVHAKTAIPALVQASLWLEGLRKP